MLPCIHALDMGQDSTRILYIEQCVWWYELDWGSGKWLAEKLEFKSVTHRHALLYR